jgi:hypothetical protein
MAVQPADDGFVEIEQREDDALGEAYILVEEVRVRGILRHVLEVSACRKCPPGTGEHDDVRMLIESRGIEGVREFLVHFAVDRIERIGTVESHREQAPLALQGNGFVAAQGSVGRR